MIAVHCIIRGHVQGVFFRASTKEKADELSITGWVRNAEDGSVELHAEGDQSAVQALVTWCHEGPPAARVDVVSVEDSVVSNFATFEIQ